MIYKASPIFDYTHQIITKVTTNFAKFVSACKKSAHFISSFLRQSRFQSPKTKETMPISYHHHNPNIIKVTFGFSEFLSTYQKSVRSIISFLRYSQFQNPETRVATPTPIFFDQLLISMNLDQNSKNQAFSLFCSRDTIDLKIMQSDWQRAFWHISQEPGFSQYGICARIQQLI